MADRVGERRVLELLSSIDATQQEAAAAHVASPDEARWVEQPLAEHLQQRLDVTRAGNAAEEDDPTAPAGERRQRVGIAQQRGEIARLARSDPYARVGAQPRDGDRLGGIAQPFTRRDDEGAAETGRRPTERARVGEFAAKIQRAEEAE